MGKITVKDKNGRVYRYLIGERIGRGGFSEVNRAERLPGDGDPQEGEPSLNRVVLKRFSGGPFQQSMIIREARILRDLMALSKTGPRRIVRIGAGGEVLEYEGSFGTEKLIELEYLDGKTLRAWLDEDRKSEANKGLLENIAIAARYARELAEALLELEEASQLHDRAYLHRDLKPENVMVTADGLRLFDFNVATDAADQTMYTQAGTPKYMAPELQSNQGVRDGRTADLYSLGIIFWELLHGEVPKLNLDQRPHVDWPSARYAPLEASAGDVLELVNDVIWEVLCDAGDRLEKPGVLIELLEKIERRVGSLIHPQREPSESVQGFDLVELLCELSPGGAASVVADVKHPTPLEAYIRKRTRVDDSLEAYLVRQVHAALLGEPQAPQLLMLSGNAGDGKSYLIERLIHHHSVDNPGPVGQMEYIPDATHAPKPGMSRQEYLEKFFQPFANGQNADKAIYIIAMNTGMVIQFFEAARVRFERGEDGACDFSELYATLRRQLGLERGVRQAEPRHRIEVVNLDLRSLLRAPHGELSFFERMLKTLDPDNEDGLVAEKFRDYERDHSRALCPVRFNLRALQRADVRAALLKILRRAELDPDVHLSPRNLWGFLYRLITGGRERYNFAERGEEDALGDVIRKKSDAAGDYAWLLEGHFYELLFNQAELGGVWRALRDHDPAFAAVPAIDRLQTLLTVRKDYDFSPEVIQTLGGNQRTLEGLSLDKLLASLGDYQAQKRNDAAVRRQVFFEAGYFEKYHQFGLTAEFEKLLESYAAYSHDPDVLSRAQQERLLDLGKQVRDAVIASFGRRLQGKYLLRVSQPNVESTTVLLVEATQEKLDEYFEPRTLIQPDAHIVAHLQGGRAELLEHLGYRPKVITLELVGHRLVVDFALYEFFSRVQRGQQPSAHDLTRFQALRFIAERLGNKLAGQSKALLVLEQTSGQVSRLFQDGFGNYELELVHQADGVMSVVR